ncbi:ATP-dependent RNA helicase MRH4 mitochondrial [Cryptococcus deuterogattii R265]|uniref:ATP-dependent RNA helicase n=1 Tax=Cryptococcus deuterogattii (strain R265) TaxID=294750 RepID=A0A095CBF4_CRYD2|nr:ATP-dependent RNA helicase MRH4 mitochondrial [Cryptococcus deuterogattii R265]KIR69791.1 ATP-dependent RNA helicase MRH4, mitochondrial [Cryptococcus deuterogattii CA1014]
MLTGQALSRLSAIPPVALQYTLRPLHSSSVLAAGGKRPKQDPSSSRYPRRQQQNSESRHGSRDRFEQPRASRFGLTSPRTNSFQSEPPRARPARSDSPSGSSTTIIPKGQHVPTSSRRLLPFAPPAAITRPSHLFKLEPATMPPNLTPKSFNRDDGVKEEYINGLPVYPTPPTTLANEEQARPRTFDDFGLEEGLVKSLKGLYGEDGKTTPIETLSFQHFTQPDIVTAPIGSQRVLLGAETGSGKTISYLIPLFHHLKRTDPGPSVTSSFSPNSEDTLHPRSLILSPTHELTRQSTQFAKLLTHSTKLSVHGMSSTVSGGVGEKRGNVDVLLGTVGSLRRMFGMTKSKEDEEKEDYIKGKRIWQDEQEKGMVEGDKVEWVVIDEADVLLGQEFYQDTISVLSRVKRANLILCTATLPPFLINLLTTNPFFSKQGPFTHLLSPGLHKLPPKLLTRFIRPSTTGNKHGDVAHQVRLTLAEDAKAAKAEGREGEEPSKIVIFCNSDKKVEQVAGILGTKKIDCLAWTGAGDERLRGRNGSLNDFLQRPHLPGHEPAAPLPSLEPKETKPLFRNKIGTTPNVSELTRRRVLVTTSLLSRGLDFHPSVSSVFLVQPPRDVLDFVHRAGRAGRAGRPGRVVVFGLDEGGTLGEGAKSNKSGKGQGQGSLKKDGKTALGDRLKDVLGKREVVGAMGKRVRT